MKISAIFYDILCLEGFKRVFLHDRDAMKTLTKCSIVLAVVLNTSAAHAAFVTESQIIPSTNLQYIPYYPQFTIDKIVDGNTSNLNGFASLSSTGTITLDLVGDFNLDSFLLWNDVNVQSEGIKDFRLDFFDNLNNLIPLSFSSTYVAPLGQLSPQEYFFNQTIQNVSRVDLVVLSSQPYTFNRIEIREVAFTGSSRIPEPTTMIGTGVALGLSSLFLKKHRQAKSSSFSN
ncbi:hypothetical protein NIES4074_19530 [Cylindrospermum sp. NIES-4074]|nr:hypothetical protein NIES4074_19530 [Cylindrospermum sp. NIES-4074]